MKAVYPAAVQLVTIGQVAQTESPDTEKTTLEESSQINIDTPCPTGNGSKAWDPPVALDHLASAQQTIAKKMLREECNAFARDDIDVGCIPTLKMHITLNEQIPVQKTYISVPKPAHQEVRVPARSYQGVDHKIKVTLLFTYRLCPQKRWLLEIMLRLQRTKSQVSAR